MTFKLPPEPREKALALSGAEPFDPGMGRPMKEWVVVPLEHAATWPEYAEQAMEFVRPMNLMCPARLILLLPGDVRERLIGERIAQVYAGPFDGGGRRPAGR